MHQRDAHLACLLLLNDFETYWAYFSLSDGALYPATTRRLGRKLLASLRQLSPEIPGNHDTPPPLPGRSLEEMLELLRRWSQEDDHAARKELLQDSVDMQAWLMHLRRHFYSLLGLEPPTCELDGSEMMYRQSFIRWHAHFPTLLLRSMGDAARMLHLASQSESIVVVGDIRRSQDLMTYARDSAGFAEKLVGFISQTRVLLDDNLGVFDKFTGDGFLAYFNKELCSLHGKDHLQCFLHFARELCVFSKGHFREWSRHVRKLPDVEVGLALGADVGCVLFQDIDAHFIAVGDAIIWANRMADTAAAGETVCNNLLWGRLESRPELLQQLESQERHGATKAGERFRARCLRFAD